LIHFAAAPVIGGVENVMRQHARLMAAAGHRVRIVAGRGQQVDAAVEFSSVPLVDSRNPEVLKVKADLDAGRVSTAFDLLVARIQQQLAPILDQADLLICHNVCSLNKNLALTAAIRRISQTRDTPRLILWHHDLAWTTPRYRQELHDGYPWSLLRSDWPGAIQVAVSVQRQSELAELLGVLPERIRVIPNGIGVARFLGLSHETEALLAEFGLLEASPLMLLPVRITPRKNIELALQVLAEMLHRFPDARLVITGPVGPHNPANAEYLDRLIAIRRDLVLGDSALFLTEAIGTVPSDEVVAELYRLADLLLLPSFEEGFGLPILEAGLVGLPIFCSDIGPLRALGGDQVKYFLPDADPGAVAALVVSTLEGCPRFALHQRILRDHTWERIYSAYLARLIEGA
jgi:glycosyltransferase involved in cell wall biosynthesis